MKYIYLVHKSAWEIYDNINFPIEAFDNLEKAIKRANESITAKHKKLKFNDFFFSEGVNIVEVNFSDDADKWQYEVSIEKVKLN